MIRFILCVIVVVGFLILSIPILLIEWIIGKFNPYRLHSQERDGKGSSAFYLDETSSLPVS